MLTDQITLAEIRGIEDEVRNHISLEILQRGFKYYMSGNVYNIMIDSSHVVRANVQGSKVYQITLDLESFINSTCTCPYEDYCKHLAATYFYLYSHFASSLLLLNRWKETQPHSHPTKSFTSTIQKEFMLFKTPLPLPKEDQSVSEWLHYFNEKYRRLDYIDAYSLYKSIKEYIETTLSHAISWKNSSQVIYSYLFYFNLLNQIEMTMEEGTNRTQYYYQIEVYRKVKQDLIDRITEITDTLGDVQALQNDVPDKLKDLSVLLHQILLNCSTKKNMHWFTIYKEMWEMPLHKHSWMIDEMKRLDQEFVNEALLIEQRDLLLYARAHFDMVMKQDEHARALYHSIKSLQYSQIYPYFYLMIKEQEWDRIKEWLEWIKPTLPYLSHHELQQLVYVWSHFAKQQQDDSDLLHVLYSLLPKSSRIYSDYLMLTERYKKWIDLQLSRKRSPYELDRESLKIIEQYDPKLLLPLYHQSIERTIAEKNRNSYKMAIRLLKKLRTHYKKLKQNERFDEYIVIISQKYARLRAFQEELRKGKLIS